jgi:hypothetical protein
MFVFACPIIDRSQCWLFALRENIGKYSYLPSNIRICPHMSAFAPEFNYWYLRSGLKDYMTKYTRKDGAYNRISIKLIHFKILE